MAEIATKGYARFETIILDRNKREIPVEIQVRSIDFDDKPALINITRDISERKAAEQALRESEERFRTLATLAPVGIYLTTPDGLCTYVNPCWCQIAGLDCTDALDTGWLQGVHPDDRDMVCSHWQQMAASNSTWEQEYRFKTPEGKVRWVRGLTTPQL